MKSTVTDIDIDVPDRNKVLELFHHTRASNHGSGVPRQHNTGIYFHDIPVDPLSGDCSIDYKDAEAMGYFKIDILNVTIYKDVRDEIHLDALIEKEPIWELLEEEDFCSMLFHMRGHHDICKQMKPMNLIELAATLAIIRPAKRYLVGKDWKYVMKHVWTKPTDGSYYFKKSHAVAYSMAVKLHMNLLVEQLA